MGIGALQFLLVSEDLGRFQMTVSGDCYSIKGSTKKYSYPYTLCQMKEQNEHGERGTGIHRKNVRYITSSRVSVSKTDSKIYH